MRFQRIVGAILLLTTLAACEAEPVEEPLVRIPSTEEVTFEPIVDCTDLPPINPDVSYKVSTEQVYELSRGRTLQYTGQVEFTPTGHGLWLFLERNGLCYGFDNGAEGIDSQITDTSMLLNGYFGFDELTRLPEVLDTAAPSNGVCQQGMEPNQIDGTCVRQQDLFYPLLVLADEKAEAELVRMANEASESVLPMPPGTFLVPERAGVS